MYTSAIISTFNLSNLLDLRNANNNNIIINRKINNHARSGFHKKPPFISIVKSHSEVLGRFYNKFGQKQEHPTGKSNPKWSNDGVS